MPVVAIRINCVYKIRQISTKNTHKKKYYEGEEPDQQDAEGQCNSAVHPSDTTNCQHPDHTAFYLPSSADHPPITCYLLILLVASASLHANQQLNSSHVERLR